jgi:hypothetical protein
MRGTLAPFPLFFLALGLLLPGIAFSASPPVSDPLETCDPSPYQMEEGALAGPSDSDPQRGRRDVRLESSPSYAQVVGPKSVPIMYGCKRTFLYRGKRRPTDSYNRQDGEKLRPVLSTVPEAIQDLETYQKNRRRISTGAYIGTAGLVMAIGGLIASYQFTGDTKRQIRTIGLLGGLSIGVGSAIYSLAILRTNESYLQRAAEKYNRTRPDDPIVLQFSTGILF